MFKEPALSALDAQHGAHYDDGKPWTLVIRPRNNFSSALVTVHASAWDLIKKVLRFSLSISSSYYDAAVDAMRKWFWNGAGDPAVFLINLEIEIAEGIRRLPNNYYVWRAYSPERHGPLQLSFTRFEQNNVNEHGPNNEFAEFHISEADVPFFRYCNGYRSSIMDDDECRSHILLERRRLLGPAITDFETLDERTRGFYRLSSVAMPGWLLLPRAAALPAHPAPALPASPSPAPSDAGSEYAGRVRPHKCPSCRSTFATVAKRQEHVRTVHSQGTIQAPGN